MEDQQNIEMEKMEDQQNIEITKMEDQQNIEITINLPDPEHAPNLQGNVPETNEKNGDHTEQISLSINPQEIIAKAKSETQAPPTPDQDMIAKLKPVLGKALRYVCQEGFVYLEFVHVTGRLSFNIDNKNSLNITVSEMLGPMAFDAVDEDPVDLKNWKPSKNKRQIRQPKKSKKPTALRVDSVGRKRGRGRPRKNPIVTMPSVRNTSGKRGRKKKSIPHKIIKREEVPEVKIKEEKEEGKKNEDLEIDFGEEEEEIVESDVAMESEDNWSETDEGRHLMTDVMKDAEDLDDVLKDVVKRETRTFTRREQNMLRESLEDLGYDDDDDDDDDENEEETLYNCKVCPFETRSKSQYREHLCMHREERPFECDLCDKTFKRSDEVKRHRRIHTRYACPCCDAAFQEQTLAIEHLSDTHNETNIRLCGQCPKICVGAEELSKHEQDAHNFVCPICGENFDQQLLLNKHKSKMHPIEALTCTECGKKCATKGALRKHITRHRESEQNFACDICGRQFTAKSTLYHHKRGVHNLDKPYKCTKCGKSFNFHHSIKLHMLQHSGERPYKCSICHKTYLTATHLKGHIQAVHGEKKKFKCAICDKCFPYENSLKMHTMLHTGDKPFMCDQCGRGFVAKSALKVHKLTHVDTKEFECDICHKKYKTDVLLRAHRRRHTEDGSRYMCDICGHTFMYKSNLEAHAAVHGEDRNYVCTICKKSFKTPATLYSHQLVHKEETPHECSLCGKSFKSKERRMAHEKRHLGLKPEMCDLCGHRFPDKGGLSKHKKTVHSAVKKFACPVCGKTCSRADNLRVHMRVHGDPGLLKLPYEKLFANDYDANNPPDEKFSPVDPRAKAANMVMQHNIAQGMDNKPDLGVEGSMETELQPDALQAAVAASGLVDMSKNMTPSSVNTTDAIQLEPIALTAFNQQSGLAADTSHLPAHQELLRNTANGMQLGMNHQGYADIMNQSIMAYSYLASNTIGGVVRQGYNSQPEQNILQGAQGQQQNHQPGQDRDAYDHQRVGGM